MNLFVVVVSILFVAQFGLLTAKASGWRPEQYSNTVYGWTALFTLALGIWGFWVLFHL